MDIKVLLVIIVGLPIIGFGMISSGCNNQPFEKETVTESHGKSEPAEREVRRDSEPAEGEKPESAEGELGRDEVGTKISGLKGESTKLEAGNQDRPSENRTIGGLEGMDLNGDK